MENRLPEEVALDIFLRLPAQYVSPSARVCKTWRRLLRGNEFVETHLRRQLQQQQQVVHDDDDDELYHKAAGSNNGGGGGASKVSFLFLARSYVKTEKKSICYGEFYNEILNYKTITKTSTRIDNKKYTSRINQDLSVPRAGDDNDSLNPHSIVGSCNGLICLSICDNSSMFLDDPVYIINPITGEEMNLPRFIGNYKHNRARIASGFGYLPSTNEYKVVRITYNTVRDLRQLVGQVEVYTLGGGIDSCNGRWRLIGEISFFLLGRGYRPSVGIFVDGALHWIDELDRSKSRIIAFDLAQEEFLEVPPPSCFQSDHKLCTFQLRVLGGCLSVAHRLPSVRADIWLLKMNKKKNSSGRTNELDRECSWSWSKEFSIAWEGKSRVQYHPVELMKSGELLLLYNKTLSLYDPKTASLKKLASCDLGLNICNPTLHVNSFVPLKALGERSI